MIIHETVAETVRKFDKIGAPKEFVHTVVQFMSNPFWKKCKPEMRLQFLVIAWIKASYPDVLVIHIENEGKRTPAGKYLAQYNGLKAGACDVMIYKQMRYKTMLGTCSGLAMELKVEDRQPTVIQLAVMEQLRAAGWAVTIKWDFPTAIKAVKDYLG